MSTEPSTDDDAPATDQTDATDADLEHLDEESALGEVFAAKRRQLAKIEAEGEQIKEVVGQLVVANEPHSDVTEEVQQILMGTLGQLVEEEEAVGLPEVIFALWLELDRATEMLVNASEQAEDDDTGDESDDEDRETHGAGDAGAASGADDDEDELAAISTVLKSREDDDSDDSSQGDDDTAEAMASGARMFQ